MSTKNRTNDASTSEPLAAPETPVAGKGAPTPTRREREAANRRPLVPTDRQAAKKESRAKLAEARERARIGMAAGEERYLPARDRGQQRRFVRDFVDSRWTVGEVLFPALFVVILLTLFLPIEYANYATLGMFAFVALAVGDAVFVGRGAKKALAARHGADKVERGIMFYTIMRCTQMRVLRLPKPQVKRGQQPA